MPILRYAAQALLVASGYYALGLYGAAAGACIAYGILWPLRGRAV